MSTKISQSAYKKYTTCPKMYDYHYNVKLRPTGTSSSLLFGTAMDEALNALLLKTGDPYEVFKSNLTYEMCSDIEWHKDDLDERLFSPHQIQALRGRAMDYKTWASLRVKGRLIIDKYISDIYPLINQVHSVQGELDGRRGFIDVIADIEGYGKVLIDHKTSSRPYKPNAVTGDVQLTLYCHEMDIDQAGFIVLNKGIKYNKECIKCKKMSYGSHRTCNDHVNGVRCRGDFNYEPEAFIQLMVDFVPKEAKAMVAASFEQIERCISEKSFPMNLTSCRAYFGKDCPYINKCLHNDESMLEYKQEPKEKK